MGSRNLLQMAEFDGFSQICKTGTQQQQASAAEFGKIPAEMSMAVLEGEIDILEFWPAVMNLRSHSIAYLNHKTGAPAHWRSCTEMLISLIPASAAWPVCLPIDLTAHAGSYGRPGCWLSLRPSCAWLPVACVCACAPCWPLAACVAWRRPSAAAGHMPPASPRTPSSLVPV
jgi:hypothetical protein